MNEGIAIKVEQVSKVFSLRQATTDEQGNVKTEHWALKDVSFEIKKGDSVGIIGPNGSGKSTLLKILAGITKPTSGSVSIRGRVASILDIGAGFHPELSGRENVFLSGQIHGFSKKEITSHFDEIVAFSGIGAFIDEPVKNYSNGMYLRLAFSILAHLEFDVYLFDEVFSVGDAAFGLKINAHFAKLEKRNVTKIFVSHNVKDLQNQNIYMIIQDGMVQSMSNSNKNLTDYLEVNSMDGAEKIVTHSTTITDFSRFELPPHFKLHHVAISQEKQHELVSNLPLDLTFSFSFQEGEHEIVVLITDILGTVILSLTPKTIGVQSSLKPGNHTVSCTLPASIFGFQTYGISLLFFPTSSISIDTAVEGSTELDLTHISSINQQAIKLDHVLKFKTRFSIEQNTIFMNKLNVMGGLIPALNWSLKMN